MELDCLPEAVHLYVPLRHLFEQNFHVRHRLDRYGAGRCMTYDEVSDPAQLARAIVDEQ